MVTVPSFRGMLRLRRLFRYVGAGASRLTERNRDGLFAVFHLVTAARFESPVFVFAHHLMDLLFSRTRGLLRHRILPLEGIRFREPSFQDSTHRTTLGRSYLFRKTILSGRAQLWLSIALSSALNRLRSGFRD